MNRRRPVYFTVLFVLLGTANAPRSLAQKGEVGAGAGGSFYNSRTVSSSGQEASTGFKHGFAAGGWIGQNMYRYLSGEIHYLFEKNDLKLSSGGSDVTFGAQSHAIHYDILIHGAPIGAKVRPFVVVGGGVKGYRGTGTETVIQPLSQFALLTKTTDWKGLLTFGGGIKFVVGPNLFFRIELRDYLTQFPEKVITPAKGASIGGWIHNLVPAAGISFGF
jgi:hypothetical protein